MEQLVKRARKGDKEAFLQLMEQSKPTMLRGARAILKNDDDVADALQETVLSAFRSLHLLREPKYFKTWLIRILINHCYTLRNKTKLIQLADFLPEEGVEENFDTALDVRGSLESLSDSDRLVLTLFYLEDMSQRDIGKLLNISENAVKQRLARGKKHFKAAYEKGAAVNES